MACLLSVRRAGGEILWPALLAGILLAIVCHPAPGATVSEATPGGLGPEPVGPGPGAQRVVVEPSWGHDPWDDWHEGWSPGGPRIRVWVDRGEWAVYRLGDPLFVYFMVDRPCYVTLVDRSPDGREELLFPNRWSGSNFARPGQTYCIPDARGYSLTVVGPGGQETIVACAHEIPWPGAPGDAWHPPYLPHRGRVVVGHPRDFPQGPGRHGRVVVGPARSWPIPTAWWDQRERWGCDSASFYVEGPSPWWGGAVDYGLLDESFTMRGCSDAFYRDVYDGRTPFVIAIECIESRRGDPTEIVGRVSWDDASRTTELFRLDAEGLHGDIPYPERTFVEQVGLARLEVRIADVRQAGGESDGPPRIDWITFHVRVLEDER